MSCCSAVAIHHLGDGNIFLYRHIEASYVMWNTGVSSGLQYIRVFVGVNRLVRAVAHICCAFYWVGRWGMDAIKRAVIDGSRECSFFADLALIARSWDGDINGTQAYVFEEYLLVVLKVRSHPPEGVKKPCALTVYANEAADEWAGAGGRMALTEDIMWPAGGSETNLTVHGRANRQYVSSSLRDEGYRQSQGRLARLGQQGAASQLYLRIGGAYKYYFFTRGVWGESAISQFRDKLFGDRLTGGERKAHGRVQSGVGGVVRVWVHHGWTSQLMKAVGYAEGVREGYAEGEEQVCFTQFMCS